MLHHDMHTPDPGRMFESDLHLAACKLHAARRIVVFTGAGASAESGIPTFRDTGGLWQEFPPERFATWRGLLASAATDPLRLARFLMALLEPVAKAVPNAAHQGVVDLEQHAEVTVITQNVDGLHQDAGSHRVLEIHGSLLRIVDELGRTRWTLTRDNLRDVVRRLERALAKPSNPLLVPWAIRPMAGIRDYSPYRPRIVLFEEEMAEPDWSDALLAAGRCDCFLCIGASGQVMPAGILPARARSTGATIITIGPENPFGGIWLRGSAGQIMPRLTAATLAPAKASTSSENALTVGV